jgi:hypothetical protein
MSAPEWTCGLRPAAEGEPARAATATAAVTAALTGATVGERAGMAARMARALAARAYVPPMTLRDEGSPPDGLPLVMPATTPQALDGALYLVRRLGHGKYGTVCAAAFRENAAAGGRERVPTLPLAVKRSVPRAANYFATAVREVALTDMLTALVTAGACPNAPCAYGSCGHYETVFSPVPVVDAFSEAADCDLSAWTTGSPRSVGQWMSVAFQTCAGLMWAGRVFDIVHNDLYGRNVLVSRIVTPATISGAPPGSVYGPGGPDAPARAACALAETASPCEPGPVFGYAVQSRAHGTRRFVVRTGCWLARPTDYGLASSDRLHALGLDVPRHDAAAEPYDGFPPGAPRRPTPAAFASLVGTRNRNDHVIFQPFLNAYARDLSVLLATLARAGEVPTPVRRWAAMGLYRLYIEVARRTPEAPAAVGARGGGVEIPGLSLKRPAAALTSAYGFLLGPGGAATTTAPPARQAPSTWAVATAALTNRAFRHADDLIDFVVGVLFNPRFLARAGLPQDLFAVGAPNEGQVFELPLMTAPPPPEPYVDRPMAEASLREFGTALGVDLSTLPADS